MGGIASERVSDGGESKCFVQVNFRGRRSRSVGKKKKKSDTSSSIPTVTAAIPTTNAWFVDRVRRRSRSTGPIATPRAELIVPSVKPVRPASEQPHRVNGIDFTDLVSNRGCTIAVREFIG